MELNDKGLLFQLRPILWMRNMRKPGHILITEIFPRSVSTILGKTEPGVAHIKSLPHQTRQLHLSNRYFQDF